MRERLNKRTPDITILTSTCSPRQHPGRPHVVGGGSCTTSTKHIFIGVTRNINKRYVCVKEPTNARWTRKHSPIHTDTQCCRIVQTLTYTLAIPTSSYTRIASDRKHQTHSTDTRRWAVRNIIKGVCARKSPHMHTRQLGKPHDHKHRINTARS